MYLKLKIQHGRSHHTDADASCPRQWTYSDICVLWLHSLVGSFLVLVGAEISLGLSSTAFVILGTPV